MWNSIFGVWGPNGFPSPVDEMHQAAERQREALRPYNMVQLQRKTFVVSPTLNQADLLNMQPGGVIRVGPNQGVNITRAANCRNCGAPNRLTTGTCAYCGT